MYDDVIDLLKRHEYFRGISDAILGEIASFAKVTNYDAAAVILQPNDPLTSVSFILRGRLKAVRLDSRGDEHLFRIVEHGDQYGIMLGGLGESFPVRIFALEPSTILSLDYEKAMELTLLHPDLRRQWLQTYARRLRRHLFEPAAARAPKLLAMIHESPATRNLAQQIIGRLQGLGEAVCRSQRRGFLAVDTRCAVPLAARRRPAHRIGGDSPASCRVEPGQPHRGRYHCGSEPGLGHARASSRMRPGIRSAP